MQKVKSLGLLAVVLLGQGAAAEQTIKLYSPNQRVQATFYLNQTPSYEVTLDGRELISPSRLGLTFQDSGPLKDLVLADQSVSESDTSYVMPFGKTKTIRDSFRQYIFKLKEGGPPSRKLEIVFRLYDDGLAFRYVIPEQPAFKNFVITSELTHFTLADEPTIYGIPLPFASSYEGYYRIGKIDAFPEWDTILLPFLLEYRTGQWMAITEASLTDFAGMYVASTKDKKNTLETRLAPMPKDPVVKVRGATPFASPWRVLIFGDSPKILVESNLVYNLNEPSAIKDTSWIKPGKIQFPWWNGYVVPHPDVGEKAGLNTWTLKHYIDFCAENNIPYHSIDGFDKAWYGGPVDPFQGIDTTEPIPEINLPEVLAYAREKNVGTRLWMHQAGLAQNVDKALALYEKWGVEGIMVDFLNRDDQEMVQFYSEVLRKTAEHHLTVTFHGVFKPTGLSRTYPHLLNHEAVLGTEYNKWSDKGSTPEHEVLIAYIRMLAGPLDTHEGSFHPIAQKDFHQSFIAPKTIGTLARQLAMYVVYENHLPMLADNPEIYGDYPEAFSFAKNVPVIWDETKFLGGAVGKYITIAREKDDEWYVGTLTNEAPLETEIDLSFLPSGHFTATVYSDGDDPLAHPDEVKVKSQHVSNLDTLKIKLAPAGGNAIRIHR